MTVNFDGALPGVGGASCPHMAILLDSVEEVAPALASFYSLGLRRNGWVFHRSLPGQADADRKAFEAEGLPVSELEREGRFELNELPLAYDGYWDAAFHEGGVVVRLHRGRLAC